MLLEKKSQPPSLQPINKPKPIQRRTILALALGAFIIVFVLWQTRSVLLYPINLMVTFVHEMGHGLAALISGGRFVSFHMYGNGAGLALTDGGSRPLILSAGYLSTALFGALLLYATNRTRQVRWVALSCGAFFIASALIFGGQGPDDPILAVGSFLALIAGLIIGMALMALGWYASRTVTVFVLNTLAFTIGFNVINDFLFLAQVQQAGIGDIPNDAAQMAQLTGMQTIFWIVIWAALAIAMMGVAGIMAFVEPKPANQTSQKLKLPAQPLSSQIRPLPPPAPGTGGKSDDEDLPLP